MICILSDSDSKKYNKNDFSNTFKEIFNIQLNYFSSHIQQELNKLIDQEIFMNKKIFCWNKAEENKSVNFYYMF